VRKNYGKKKVDLLVIRFNNRGELRDSAPCIDCLNTLKNMENTDNIKIKRIWYSVNNGIVMKKLEDMETSHISNGNMRIRKLLEHSHCIHHTFHK
tara:strand:- start:371 stop:655 length:285 start_codon:yes stop_codon:yes gene_type:complete